MNILQREQILRLFQQLHQNDFYYEYWRRSSGSMGCEKCGLQYREHLNDEEHPHVGDGFDKRICNGDIVHL
jgi:hypothetical protein